MPGNERRRDAFASIRQVVSDHYRDVEAEPEIAQILKLIDHASLLGWVLAMSDYCTNGEEIGRSVGIARMALLGKGSETVEGEYRLSRGQQFRIVVALVNQAAEAMRQLDAEPNTAEKVAEREEQLSGLVMDGCEEWVGRQPDPETIRDVLRAVARAKNVDEKWLAHVPLFAAMGFDLGSEGNEAENLRRLVEQAISTTDHSSK
jgi:hypothetical protein